MQFGKRFSGVHVHPQRGGHQHEEVANAAFHAGRDSIRGRGSVQGRRGCAEGRRGSVLARRGSTEGRSSIPPPQVPRPPNPEGSNFERQSQGGQVGSGNSCCWGVGPHFSLPPRCLEAGTIASPSPTSAGAYRWDQDVHRTGKEKGFQSSRGVCESPSKTCRGGGSATQGR